MRVIVLGATGFVGGEIAHQDDVVPGIQISISLFVPLASPPANRSMRAPAAGHLTFTHNGDPERGEDEPVVDTAREHRGLDRSKNVDNR